MQKIKKGIMVPSAAFSITPGLLKNYQLMDKPPEDGDVAYGMVTRIGQHSALENKSGRIHMIHNGTMSVFVFGNRYAPDFYEGLVPPKFKEDVDLIARSGLIGQMKTKNALIKDPTKVKLLGYVVDAKGRVLNTKNYRVIQTKSDIKKFPRAKMILVCGTSMNAGKSMAATACCWALTTMGHSVRAAKVTGTASLKDILNMNDAGAEHYADFTYLGYPSTYKLNEDQLLEIFNKIDLKYANNPKNYWVVEFADGIIQRETAMLLASPDVKKRIHKLIFCAPDAFGAIGGLRVLKEKFNLVPNAISGICSSSPLHIRELSEQTDIPVFNSADPNAKVLQTILSA